MKNIEEIAQEHVGQEISIVGNGPTLVRMPDHRSFFGRYMQSVIDRKNGVVKDINDYGIPPTRVMQLNNHPRKLWTVNGGWSYHPESNLGFLMDDHKFHRDETHPQAGWYDNLMKTSTLPIMTSRAYPNYPAMVEYPLKEIAKMYGTAYFGETIDYMVALAGYFEVKKVYFLGCDYQFNDRFPAERAGTEYWIGRLEERGIECDASPSQNLMKQAPREIMYDPTWYGFAKDNPLLQDPELKNMELSHVLA